MRELPVLSSANAANSAQLLSATRPPTTSAREPSPSNALLPTTPNPAQHWTPEELLRLQGLHHAVSPEAFGHLLCRIFEAGDELGLSGLALYSSFVRDGYARGADELFYFVFRILLLCKPMKSIIFSYHTPLPPKYQRVILYLKVLALLL